MSTIPRAERTGKLAIVTEAHVTRIDVDADGRAAGVQYLKGGETYIQPASVVLLAGYTYENARLLLLSTSAAYPRGLANNGGQVGRHYFTHNQAGGVLALFPHQLNRWYGLPAQGVAVDDFADDNFDHAGLDFIGGGNLWVYSDQRPIAAAEHADVRPRAALGLAVEVSSSWRTRTAGSTRTCRRRRCRTRTTYLDLHPTVKDPLGDPVIRITADHKDNEKRVAAFVQDKMEQWFLEAGAVATLRQPLGTMGVSTHAYGGTRMGDDPETNVVDRWGFCHEVPNLGVLGASVMGTSGAHNPTLTAQALAWRTAERLVADWGTIAG